MLHKIPTPVPTPEGIFFIAKVTTSLTLPYSMYAYCVPIDATEEEDNQPSWWGFTSDEVLNNTELDKFKYVLFEAGEVDDAMDWFIQQFGVESMAGEVDDVDWFMQQFGVESMSGDAPMQAEGGQL